MTDATNDSWSELRSKLTSLGLKLKLHFEQEQDAAEKSTASVRGAFEEVGETMKAAFEALGNAVDDDAVREDAREAGRLLIDAVEATFAEVSSDLREKLGRD